MKAKTCTGQQGMAQGQVLWLERPGGGADCVRRSRFGEPRQRIVKACRCHHLHVGRRREERAVPRRASGWVRWVGARTRRPVTAKRGSAKRGEQICVFGSWFYLQDTDRILPVQQLEWEDANSAGGGEEGEESASESSDAVPNPTRKRNHSAVVDSSDED